MPEQNVIVKFANHNYINNILKLLRLSSPNTVLPVESELYELEDKINNCKTAFTDSDDNSTVALTSNPSSFASNESAEDYYSTNTYTFTPNKFKMVSVLGTGSFGTVFLAEYDNTHYAIKKLPKSKINKDEIEQVMLEKQILMSLSNPFILQLYGTYQTTDELCFITEVLEHGDLYSAIYDGDKLSHEACVFYSIGILLGIDYIHSNNITYRDLKPENIMITENGYPKIIDFGLARQLPYSRVTSTGEIRNYSMCHTLCGTPEYVAPEIILSKSYDYAVDLWSFGVLLYEMICRKTPFSGMVDKTDYITKLFTNITTCGRNGISISIRVDKKADGTSNARDLITQLLSGDKAQRYGMNNNKPSDLLKHPYFSCTAMNDIYNQTMEAPILQPQYIGSDISSAKKVKEFIGDQEIFSEF